MLLGDAVGKILRWPQNIHTLSTDALYNSPPLECGEYDGVSSSIQKGNFFPQV